jgi:2,3-bisphosphoglycerate-independent phosphoglycerate mutase
VHLIGLLSDGEVDSSLENLYALLRFAKYEDIQNIFVHCILDGRDVQPRMSDIYVEALEIKLSDIGVGKIATLCGRYYAMDKDQNWERTARSYTMLVHSEGERASDPVTAIRSSFLRGISDEFIQPIILEDSPACPSPPSKTTMSFCFSIIVPRRCASSSKCLPSPVPKIWRANRKFTPFV